MRIERPFHAGELEVQRRLGELDEGRRNGRAIADSILGGAFKFVEQQTLVVAGSVDSSSRPWTSLLFGPAGFARVVDERLLELDLARTLLHPEDPLRANLETDARIGLLFIELGTRRRLRVNGNVRRDGELLRVDVQESYPNCPKYIQRRHLRTTLGQAPARCPAARSGSELTPDQAALVARADTFFLASHNPEGGVDVSHRGGPPGFAALRGMRLRVPDYEGNRMYNTLGNLTLDPRASVTLLDFETGRLLFLGGTTRILWSENDADELSGGTGRFWELEIDRVLELATPVALEWEFLDASPYNPPGPPA